MQRDCSGRPLRLFLTFYRPHRRLFALDLLFSLLSCLADLAFPYVSRQAMQHLLPLGLFRTFFAIMAALLAAYLLKAVFKYAVTVIGHQCGVLIEADMRQELFEHLQTMSFRFFDCNRTGVLMSRMTSDLFSITELAHHGPEYLLTAVVTLGGALAILAPICWQLALVLLLLVPLLWELVHDAVQRRRVSIRQAAGLLLVTLGFAAYCYINWRVAGNPFQFLIYQREHWNQRTGLFFSTAAYQPDYLLRCLRSGNWHDALGLWLPNLIACFSALILLAKTAPRLRASQTAWFLAYYIIAVGATWLLSAPRYLLVLLPVPLELAHCAQTRHADRIHTALSALAAHGYLAAFALRWQVW